MAGKITVKHRKKIEELRSRGHNIKEIARIMKCVNDRSIRKEIERNGTRHEDGTIVYSASVAQKTADGRKRTPGAITFEHRKKIEELHSHGHNRTQIAQIMKCVTSNSIGKEIRRNGTLLQGGKYQYSASAAQKKADSRRRPSGFLGAAEKEAVVLMGSGSLLSAKETSRLLEERGFGKFSIDVLNSRMKKDHPEMNGRKPIPVLEF